MISADGKTPRIGKRHRGTVIVTSSGLVNATADQLLPRSNSVKDLFGPFMPAILCQQKTTFIKKTSLFSKFRGGVYILRHFQKGHKYENWCQLFFFLIYSTTWQALIILYFFFLLFFYYYQFAVLSYWYAKTIAYNMNTWLQLKIRCGQFPLKNCQHGPKKGFQQNNMYEKKLTSQSP